MHSNSQVPAIRIRAANTKPVRSDGQWVVYWMTAFRRTRYNFALQRALEHSLALDKPLIILEAIRLGYRWASDRFHRFVIEGMRDNQAACNNTSAFYFPYVELEIGQGAGLVAALAEHACAVVSDDFPCFFHPAMIRAAAPQIPSAFEVVDSNCLMPLAITDRVFTVAHSYRRFMQKELPNHLEQFPEPDPLNTNASKQLPKQKPLPKEIAKRWRQADFESLTSEQGLKSLPIDHSVSPVAMTGGSNAAGKLLNQFINRRLQKYDQDRNEPDNYGSSELSPYLHFGHIAAHEVFDRIMQREKWHVDRCLKPNGKVNGFWNVSENAEAFLDQLCTWREIGFNMCRHVRNYAKYESLPDWAKKSLAKHRKDPRPQLYSLEQLEKSQTHDPIWNAAQRQLVREGRIHNYLRMLWGKKILQWTESAEEALEVMIELNNKYALDGRNPNSYSGIFWVLGRYDRAWGPERPIFGSIRYMTSENTAKKHALKEYLKRYTS
jgi:deoxyribodipyrimidine photo-lyase